MKMIGVKSKPSKGGISKKSKLADEAKTLAIYKDSQWPRSDRDEIIIVGCMMRGKPRLARTPSHGSWDGRHLEEMILVPRLPRAQEVGTILSTMPFSIDTMHLRLFPHSL